MKRNGRLTLLPEQLLKWYDQNARVLPWREDPLPYRVWVSEIMLQQTRVEAVKPYFDRFMIELPDIYALAEASEDRLLKLWEGLGYYSRVRNLQKAAKIIVEKYHGELPQDHEKLCELPGIGEYTAGAIASIAYQLPYPAVDGNVLRVFSRLLCCYDNLLEPIHKKKVITQIKEILPRRVGDFNQALMELGATICRPNGAPLCESCPISSICLAYQNGVQEELPIKPAKIARKQEKRTVLLIFYQDTILLRQRPEKGLLAKLWEFPNESGWLTKAEFEDYIAQNEWSVSKIWKLAGHKHVFTHLEWHLKGYALVLDKKPDGNFISLSELQREYSIPNAFLSYLKEAENYLQDFMISQK